MTGPVEATLLDVGGLALRGQRARGCGLPLRGRSTVRIVSLTVTRATG